MVSDGLGLLVRPGESNLFLDDWGDGFHFFGSPRLVGKFAPICLCWELTCDEVPRLRLESPTSCNMT